ncbi:GxxExxY protein [Natronospira sp.]|uniref:GxxExxY protein n=1 Tax=Natronospira sp. TaxID=2024970 RepID=UPI003873A696
MDENAIGTQVIGASIRVHEGLGPGLLESVYETALAYELEEAGLSVKRQVPVPIVYRRTGSQARHRPLRKPTA